MPGSKHILPGCVPETRTVGHNVLTAYELLKRQAAAQKASESIIQVVPMQQPTADFLISITIGVRKLVEAAVRLVP